MKWHVGALLLAAFVAACSSGAPAVSADRDDARTIAAATDRFELRSDPWVNLHHFLYEWARSELQIASGRPAVVERYTADSLSRQERAAWRRAVQYYQQSVVTVQPDIALLSRRLEEGFSAGSFLMPVLQAAMPVYRVWWWEGHDRRNREWITDIEPLLRSHEGAFVTFTESVVQAEWPEHRRRIDVSAHSPLLGYAALTGRIVVHSSASENQGLHGLEILLHELLHTPAIAGGLAGGLTDAIRESGLEVPAEAGHALIYATAGEFVAMVAIGEGRPEHIPFWVHGDFERLSDWRSFGPAIREHWWPVLRGELPLAAGLRRYVREVGSEVLEE